MQCASVILLCSTLVASSALAAGCQQQGLSEQEKADIRDSWSPGSSQAVMHPQSALLADGAAPLLYQAREPGSIRVIDSASGAVLATASVGRGTMIRVDPDNGIYVAERLIRPGPLAQGRRFSILLDLNPANDWETRVEAPKPAPPPATRPADGQIVPPF